MRKFHKRPVLIAEINITPFTDVILVLLIIFMIATPLIAQKNIEVKLPVAASKDVLDEPKPVYIKITAEGVVYLNNKLLTSKELKQQMSSLVKKNPNLKVVVAIDQACRFQEIVKVIDVIKELGVKSLNIATRANE